MSAEPARWYDSKIDWWLYPLLCLPPLAAIAVCVTAVVTGSAPGLLIGVVNAVFVAVLYFGLVFPIRYGIDDSELIVRLGLIRKRVPLSAITSVEPTSNPLSSPALSLDRLRVQYGKGPFRVVRISPENRDEFLDDLAEKAGLCRDGNRLVRESPDSDA